MPTIELFGYRDAERQALEQAVRAQLEREAFAPECVFVESPPSVVRDWIGAERPFVRISTRSSERAQRFKDLLHEVCDVEVVRIDFQPRRDAASDARPDFEQRLVEALQPIRGFALAQGIHHLFVSGIFDGLDPGGRDIAELATALQMDCDRLRGFLFYLANEDLVELSGDAVALTPRARALREFRPWYELLVGGYAQTLQQVTEVLQGNGYASRDDVAVGVGSCGIGEYDALPLVRTLLRELPAPPAEIVDLGCGDGRFLASLAQDHPGARAIGVDPFAPANGHNGVAFYRCSAREYVHVRAHESAGSLYLMAFVLQELLEQEGRPAVVQLVREAVRAGAHLAIVEVDHRPNDPAIMRHGLGLSYYNPYYLLHVLTKQRLETIAFWLELFSEAGARVVAQRYVNPQIDSTGLEFGCLLTSR